MTIMDYRKLTCRWGGVCAALLGVLLFAGCKMLSSSDPDFPDMPVPGQTAPAGETKATPAIKENGAELIHVGDSLTVVFSDLPTAPPQLQVQVDENGKITLIENQTFAAAGKTRAELEQEIRERYVPSIYTKMTVTITRPERLFYVGGEVKTP